jgi:hypothetical protein
MLRSEPNRDHPGFARDLLHLYTLSAFAVSQPLFDRLSGHVTYLIDRGITRVSLVLLAAVVMSTVPTLLAAVEALIRAVCRPWQRTTHSVFAGLLLVLLACPVARHIAEHEPLIRWGVACYLTILMALVAGGLMTIVYTRTTWFGRWVTWASPAMVLFPTAFLLFGPAETALSPIASELRTARAGNPVPVVMIVFDEFCGMSLLNEEHLIDPVRYPNFARLADTATWYRNATTVHPRTSSAVPAMLTGAMPQGPDHPMTESGYPRNLFRLLQDTGQYDFVVFESVGRLASRELNRQPPDYPERLLPRVAIVLPTLCAVYLHAVLPPDLPVNLPRVPPEWFGLTSDFDLRPVQGKGVFLNPWIGQRAQQCQRFLTCLDRSSKPSLSFIHLCLPHYPWNYLPSGRRYREELTDTVAPPGGFGPHGEVWTADPFVVEDSWRRYLLQVGYVDRFIGRLQDRLQELGLFDECLLIVTADHGVAFLPGHSRREPDGANLSEILSIPLLIKYPRQRTGVVDDRNVESIDILPTIADALDLKLPFSVDGNSALDDSVPPRTRKTLVRGNGELIVVDPRFPSKYDSVQRLIAAFGTGTRDDRFWSCGLSPDLIGRHIDTLPVRPDADTQIELIPVGEDSSGDDSDIIPCRVQGRVVHSGHDVRPLTLAVTVNGVIAGITRTSIDPRISNQFAVMLPEDAFSTASDELRLFAVLPGDGAPMLTPCRVVGASDGG